ncbi:MAG: serine hydrolase domain-containing protein [Candidatus Heimdallarchaeaceae archaeon]
MDTLEDNTLSIIDGASEGIKNRIQRVNENILNFNFDGRFSFSGEKSTILEKMKQYNVPGVCIAVINNYELEWIKCFGVKDVRTGEPITLDTLLEVGSTSKSFTAVAALSFVGKKLLELDEDVNNKLTSWKIPNNEFTEKAKISLKHILSHRAGINGPNGGFRSEPNSAPTLVQMFKGEKPSLSDPFSVEFIPGTSHAYSNYGYVLVQMLLEDIAKKPFPDVVDEYIFQPLNMKNSSFKYPTEETQQRLAVPHDQEGKAKETGLQPTALSQGGLTTTALDLSKFYIDIMNTLRGEESIFLTHKIIEQMVTPVLDLDPTKFFGMTGQGLGTFVIDNGKNKFFTHPGTNWPGATCLPIICAETGQGVIIITNGIRGELLQSEIMNSVAREYGWTLWES